MPIGKVQTTALFIACSAQLFLLHANGENVVSPEEKSKSLVELHAQFKKSKLAGDYEGAEKILLQELALEDQHSEAYAVTLDEHAEVLRHLFRFVDAEKESSQANSIRKILKQKSSNEQSQSWTDPAEAAVIRLQGINNMEELSMWSSYYYLHPRPDLTVAALKFSDKSGILEGKSAQSPAIALYAQVFARNPKQLAIWIKELNGLKTESKVIVWKALYFASTAEALQQANILRKQLPPDLRPIELTATSKKAPLIESVEVTPEVLDMLWGSFFSVGMNAMYIGSCLFFPI